MDKEMFEGTFNGEQIRVFRNQFGHRLTDAEIEALLRGEYVTFPATSKAGKPYNAVGRLEKDGRFYKFKLDFDYRGPMFVDPDTPQKPPAKWCGYEFSPTDIEVLEQGGRVKGHFTWKSGKSSDAEVEWVDEDGSGVKRIRPIFDN